jgi:hypothetical protein
VELHVTYGSGARLSALARGVIAAAALAASHAGAAAAERDKAWDALIAAAKARGAEETKLDRSASFVFQREDGAYVTFTRLLTTPEGRSVCLIAKELTTTACVDWETGKVKLGRRKDAATPWKFFAFDSLEALEAAKPTMLDRAMLKFNSFLFFISECTHTSFGQIVPNKKCEFDNPPKEVFGD